MLTHEKFGRLRLQDFISSAQVRALTEWEFMDRMWVGEAVGFTEWLRPEERPNVLESMALDMADLPEAAMGTIEFINVDPFTFFTGIGADDKKGFL